MQFLLYVSAFGAAVLGWICMMGFGSILGRYRRAENAGGHGVGRDAMVHDLFVQFLIAAGLIIVATVIAAVAGTLGTG